MRRGGSDFGAREMSCQRTSLVATVPLSGSGEITSARPPDGVPSAIYGLQQIGCSTVHRLDCPDSTSTLDKLVLKANRLSSQAMCDEDGHWSLLINAKLPN